MERANIVSRAPLTPNFMESLKNKISKWGFFWGIVYGLVALGFYFTPFMLLILGLASFSTAVALQSILFYEYRWHFLILILGMLLVFTTVLIYLRSQGVRKLTIADITRNHLFIGTLATTFIVVYLILFWLVTFIFPPN